MKLEKKYYIFTAGLTILSILMAIANTAQPLIVEQFINQLGKSEQNVLFWAAIYFLSIIVILTVEMIRKLGEAKYVASLKDWFRVKVSNGILNRTAQQFAESAPQEYISLMNNEVPAVVEKYYVKIVNLIFQVLSILFTCTVLIKIYFPLAAISAGASILIAVTPFFFEKKMQQKTDKKFESLAQFNVKFSDVVFGHSEIRIQQIKKAIGNIVNLASHKSEKSEFAYEKVQAYSEIVMGFISFMGTFLIITLGGYQVHEGKLNVGSLFAAIQLSDQLIMPILGISTSLNSIISTRKVKAKLFTYASVEEKKSSADLGELQSISIEHMTLNFGDRYIFKNYTKCFEKNKKYLIIGQNGSGKSTLIHAIVNSLDTKAATLTGTIRMNGKKQEDVSDEDLFRNLTIVSQVPYMFSGTVKDNITLFGKEDVKNLSNYSMLVDDSFWKLIDDDRDISNESTHISNGEREKIALLRALMRQNSWLILDEATAALDKKSKPIFEKYILDRDDMTVLHISHNFQEEDAKMYDEIIVIGE